MLRAIVRTEPGLTPLILRVMLGIVFLPHGLQKTLGWFGGSGFSATMNMFENRMHIPVVFALLAIAAEFLGAIGLLTGFLTRIAAFGIAVEMLVAVIKVHRVNGFFMNWSGSQKGEGIEYHLLVLAICAAVMITGAGSLSLDRWLYKKLRSPFY
jgi:putative oxidoreductase